MSRKALTLAMAMLVLAFLSVLIVLSVHGGQDNYTPVTNNGAVIFEEACARCHGPSGLGGETKGPRLAGHVLDPAEVKRQVVEGQGRMPRFPNINGAALENLGAYVNGLE